MTWGMQVLIGENWHWVSPNMKPPYQYETEEEAFKMLSICYPDRIIEQKLGSKETVRIKENKD
jgi:hypothetical protein